MRPFFRILKTTIYMIKRNQAWFWKIFRAIKSIIIFTFRMILATILGLASIVAIFEWNEKPSHIHLLIFGIVSVFVVINQIVIMTYESEKWFRGVVRGTSPIKTESIEAYGSATVEAYGSATVEAYGSATVEACDNSYVEDCTGNINTVSDHGIVKDYYNHKIYIKKGKFEIIEIE